VARFLIKWIDNNQFGDQLIQNAVQFYQAVEIAVSSWDDASRKTISNCFRHCGFFRAKCSMEEKDDGSNEFKQIESQLRLKLNMRQLIFRHMLVWMII
jgi:hypothetical protein